MRAVIHLDMDAFFAAVEIRDRPGLDGDPVVVGADPHEGSGRGVVSTCNYPAREYGIKSGMPIAEAYERCPDATFLPVDGETYRRVSERIMTALADEADRFEQTSIDEAYLALETDRFDAAIDDARHIKERIQERFDLTCSLGVATNKTVAKIASDTDKPDGLTVVRPDEARAFLADKPVSVIPGVGQQTRDRLTEEDIYTAGDLAALSSGEARDLFGRHGLSIRQKARGIDDATIGVTSERKSLGTETTFQEDLGSVRGLKNHVRIMAREIGQGLIQRGLRFRTVEIKLRRSDFETHTRQRTLSSSFRSPEMIEQVGCALLEEAIEDREYRLIGLRVKNIEHMAVRQARLKEFLA